MRKRNNIYADGGYSPEELYKFLFDDDEEKETSNVTAPSEEELQNAQDEIEQGRADLDRQRKQLQEDSEDMEAMGIATNPYLTGDRDRTKRERGNPYGSFDGSGIGPIDTNQNADYAFNFFKEKGVPEHVAAGIVGNLMHESGLNPYATGDNGKATGVAQWHPDRFNTLKRWAMSQNKDPFNLNTQLEFVLNEPGESQKAINATLKTKNSSDAAVIWAQTYERPGIPSYNKRIGYAKKYSQQEGGRAKLQAIIDTFQKGGKYTLPYQELINLRK